MGDGVVYVWSPGRCINEDKCFGKAACTALCRIGFGLHLLQKTLLLILGTFLLASKATSRQTNCIDWSFDAKRARRHQEAGQEMIRAIGQTMVCAMSQHIAMLERTTLTAGVVAVAGRQ